MKRSMIVIDVIDVFIMSIITTFGENFEQQIDVSFF